MSSWGRAATELLETARTDARRDGKAVIKLDDTAWSGVRVTVSARAQDGYRYEILYHDDASNPYRPASGSRGVNPKRAFESIAGVLRTNAAKAAGPAPVKTVTVAQRATVDRFAVV